MKDNTQNTVSEISRRNFIKKSAVAGFAFTIIPAYLTSARAADNPMRPPSQRINLGCIGVGARATGVIPALCKKGNATPVAFADVDYVSPKRIEQNLTAFPNVKRYHDFRMMLDEMGNDIDAVSVVTPDHTHFVAAIHAMSLGKHVYVEKPLTHTFNEAEMLMRAEKKFGVVTQMGNQGHTASGSEQFKAMAKAGLVDDIVKIEAWKSGGLWFMDANKRFKGWPAEEPKPPSLKNWDLWCGPCKVKPFSSMYHPFNWRGFHAYGSGMLGDWGCHIIDYVHDYLKLGLPTKIEAVEMGDHDRIKFPLTTHIKFKFPKRGSKLPTVDMIWKSGGKESIPSVNEKFGDKQSDGSIKIPNPGGGGTLLHRKQNDYLVQRSHHHRPSRIYPREKMLQHKDIMKAVEPELNHFESFVQACMGNSKTQSPFSSSGMLTQVLNLGMIAEYLNEDLNFDPQKKRFKGNDEANVLLNGPEPRKEWAHYYRIV